MGDRCFIMPGTQMSFIPHPHKSSYSSKHESTPYYSLLGYLYVPSQATNKYGDLFLDLVKTEMPKTGKTGTGTENVLLYANSYSDL